MVRNASKNPREQRAHNFRVIRLLIALLCVFAAFVAGFSVRGNAALLERIGFSAGAASVQTNPGLTVSGNTYDSLSARVAEVQGIIDQNSIESYDLSKETDSVINTITSSADDPYLRYYNSTRYAAYLKDATNSNYGGVGVLFSENNGKAYAVDVFEGSEAASKGVKSGDYVVAIDGDRGNNGWTQVEAVKKIARDEGEEVIITWRRPASLDAEGGTEYTVTLTSATYKEPNVTTELSDNVGYIKLTQITQNSATLVKQAIQNLASQGATSYVLDLRDNPGGYLTQAIDLGSLFVKSGVLVEIQSKSTLSTKTATGATVTDAPLVVLVNGSTAAAAEMLAGALQDNARATIVGSTTLGKGSVQSIEELSFGGALRYTSALYKTPKGYDINDVGIDPDIQVDAASDADTDTQKSLAVGTAQSLTSS